MRPSESVRGVRTSILVGVAPSLPSPRSNGGEGSEGAAAMGNVDDHSRGVLYAEDSTRESLTLTRGLMPAIQCRNCGLMIQVPEGGRRLCGCGAWLSSQRADDDEADVVLADAGPE